MFKFGQNKTIVSIPSKGTLALDCDSLRRWQFQYIIIQKAIYYVNSFFVFKQKNTNIV